MSSSQETTEKKEKKEPAPLSSLPRLFVSRRWWWVSLLVIAGMVITFRLGIWQLDRLQQRRAENAEFIEQNNAASLVLDSLPLNSQPSDLKASGLKDRNAMAVGRFDFSEQIVLVQQNYQGRPGGHLVAPFIIAGGDEAILVDRGWIPAHEIEQGDFKTFSDPNQDKIHGSLQPSQTLSGGRETEVEGHQQEWYRIDINAIQEQMPYDLAQVFLLEKPPSEVQEELPIRVEPEIDLSDGPHLGYAIQWFFFCTILAIGYAYFVRTRSPVK
jgi:surfeit locus 1 family protein